MPQESLEPDPATEKQLKLLAMLDEKSKIFKSEGETKEYYRKKYGVVSRKDLKKVEASTEIDLRNASIHIEKSKKESNLPVHNAEIVDQSGSAPMPISINNLTEMVSAKIALESIMESSKDGLGEGILYHNAPGIGLLPSADLIDMIVSQAGFDVKTTILNSELRELKVNDQSRLVWYAKVRVESCSGKVEEAEAHEPADMTEAWIKGEKYRTKLGKEIDVKQVLEDRKVIRHARRIAFTRLLGIPTSILPIMAKKMLETYKSQQSQQ